MQAKRKFKNLSLHLSGLPKKRDLLFVHKTSPGSRRIAGVLFFKRGRKNLRPLNWKIHWGP